MVHAYFRHAQTRYVKHGNATSEVACIRYALRPVRQHNGTCTVADFEPKALKDVRQAMADSGRCRTSIHKDAERVKRMFKWAVGEEMLDPDRNPFPGFIQSLTYAVEISTPAQRSRLAAAYPGRFAWPEGGPYIDIALLLIRYPNEPGKVEFLHSVRGLVEQLAVPDTPFSQLVRRVLCLRTEVTTPECAEFVVEFVVPGSVTPSSGRAWRAGCGRTWPRCRGRR